MSNRNKMRTSLRRLATAVAIAAVPATALAQDYPNRAIRIVVPVTPGGTNDALARIVGEKLTARFGQPVVIENKPGGAMHLGTEAVHRSEPDGYTLLATSWFAIVAPPKTPPAIAGLLSQVISEALRMPDVVKRLRDFGATAVGGSPAETADFIKAETERWRRVIVDADVRPE